MQSLLLRHHEPLVARIGAKLPASLRRTIGAEDVAQETYVEAFKRIGTFEAKGPDAFFRWLTTIATHKVLDFVRAQRTAKRGGGWMGISRTRETGSSVASLLERLAVDEHTPSQSARNHEAAAQVQVALATLSEEHREVLQLRYGEGRSEADIALRMNRSKEAVHSLCYRALSKLRATLDWT